MLCHWDTAAGGAAIADHAQVWCSYNGRVPRCNWSRHCAHAFHDRSRIPL